MCSSGLVLDLVLPCVYWSHAAEGGWNGDSSRYTPIALALDWEVLETAEADGLAALGFYVRQVQARPALQEQRDRHLRFQAG